MLKRLMHIMVLLAFVVSTMPSLAMAMPASMTDHQMMSHKMAEEADGQQHHASTDMAADHSCCKDKQANDNQGNDDHKKCCDGDCQCMMNGCAKTQTLHQTLSSAFSAISKKLSFITSNERHDDSIAYLLKRPPKA